MNFLKAMFGNYSKREVKRVQPICDKVLALEDKYAAMSESELKNQTTILKERLANGETTDDILPEAFATCREAGWRVLGMKHFPVQIIGGIVLHQGRIAEMKTGEGKTLVATLPAYLNALTGEGVHIVTVNDYLARRDSEWMGKLYRYLGLSVGLICHDLDNEGRKKAYAADITYGTNNELGFDYLRDNMVVYKENKVQRPHAFAIVDEVDSILIDEARTPLIISGKGDKSTDLYAKADAFAKTLKVQRFAELDAKEDMEEYYKENDIDYVVDEKQKTATLTQSGVKKAEEFFGIENLTDPDNLTIQHHVNQAIKANGVMKLDVDYVVKDGEVIIVDEFTGRLMYGRRFNEGLHQAIEAKEGVKVQSESKTLATITFQNYFRLYKKLSGMTGTAQTESEEFQEIYKLDVVEIPTNKPVLRKDLPDSVYKTENGKFHAVIDAIVEAHEKGQPVLVGTISIEKSELLSKMLKKRGIKHNVLNAKQHEKEAEIVAQAGKLGAVTIATNMAGRGTDIKLSPEVKAAGGLAIIGTERHESRRVDRQLRGRAGRQGDPGSSVFFVSLEDDLMRLFSSDRIASVMDRLGFQEGEMIEHKMISNSIERAQKKVEENNFGIRKRLLEYDDVMNKQRTVVYTKRRHALMGERIGMDIVNMIWDRCANAIENNDYEGCQMELLQTLAMETPFTEEEFRNEKKEKLADKTFNIAMENFKRKTERLAQIANPVIKQVYENQGHMYENILIPITDGKRMYNISCNLKAAYESESKEVVKSFEKSILLHVIDEAWKENLRELDELKHSVQNASYEQKDPLLIYKLESVTLFDAMVNKINNQTVSILMRGQIPVQEAPDEPSARRVEVRQAAPEQRQDMSKYRENKQDLNDPNQQAAANQDTREQQKREPIRAEKTVGRNDPCPCGSGKKYKNCHGRNF